MTLYVENSKGYTKKKKNGKKINKFSKVGGYKKQHPSRLYFYTGANEQYKEEIKKNNSIHNSIKNNKIGINWSRRWKTSWKNYKTLLKEIKGNLNELKDTLCSQIRRFSIVKITLLHKVIYRVNAISIKIPMAFFAEMKWNSWICWPLEIPPRHITAKVMGSALGIPGFKGSLSPVQWKPITQLLYTSVFSPIKWEWNFPCKW